MFSDWHYFSRRYYKCEVMEVLLIVLSLIAAYVLFVFVGYLLARLLFPKIEVQDIDDVKPGPTRAHEGYAPPTVKKQKNLAY